MTSFVQSSPSAHGVAAAGIADYLDALERAGIEMHSLMVLRHGEVLAQGWWSPFAPDRRHLMYSLSKSFTSMAAGIAWGEGAFDLDDLVVDVLPEVVPDELDDRFRGLRVRHVLSMATGHEHDTLEPGWRSALARGDSVPDLARGLLTLPPEREPGSVFAYNQLATHTAARIVERHAGVRLLDYLQPRLFEPLGITDPAWFGIGGHDLGFSGLHTHTGAIAALGQLLLQRGRWGDAQLVPAEWIEQATRLQQRNDPPDFTADPEFGGSWDWRSGYGFQFWMGTHGYRGDGAYGQFCVVWPEEEVVVVTTACTPDMGLQLDLAYRHLLPAVRGEGEVSAAADAALAERLGSLEIPLPVDAGAARSSGEVVFERVGSQSAEPVAASGLSRVAIRPDGDGWVARLQLGDVEGELPIGRGLWLEGVWPVGAVPFVSAGGFGEDGVFRARLQMIETPHHLVVEGDPGSGTCTVRWNQPPLHSQDPADHALT